MKFLIEKVSGYKYFALSKNSSEYYNTLEEVKRDLINFIPSMEEPLNKEDRVIVYSLSNVEDIDDLGSEDIIFEFYGNKLYYADGRVVSYKPQTKKEFIFSDPKGKRFKVKAYTKPEASRIFKNYLGRL